jgi:OOP family OmpA-OmpF porin
MNRILFIFSLQFLSLGMLAQNLIVDGSFEAKSECPPAYGLGNLIEWTIPNTSSSDYMCECYPSTSFGFELKTAFANSCNIGLLLHHPPSGINDPREYAMAHLNKSLEVDSKYCFSVFVVMSSTNNYALENIHVGFLNDSSNQGNIGRIEVDSYYHLSSTVFEDSLNWTKLEVEFIASGIENYIVIGNFDSIQNLKIKDYQKLTSPPFLKPNAYYFFDNASLTKCLPPLEDDFVIYPNPSSGGEIYTEFDADTTGVIELYNSLGQIVRSRDIPKGNFKGELFQQLATGVYIVSIQTDSGYRREQKLVVTK